MNRFDSKLAADGIDTVDCSGEVTTCGEPPSEPEPKRIQLAAMLKRTAATKKGGMRKANSFRGPAPRTPRIPYKFTFGVLAAEVL